MNQLTPVTPAVPPDAGARPRSRAQPDGPGRRVIVVGAGPGGLATAMLLRAAGAEVTVIEKQDRVGGRTSSFSAEGFRFDLGPTFFLYPQILAEIFAACGFDFGKEVELVRLDPMYDLVFEAGGRIRATADLAKLQADVARFSPEDAEKVPAFIKENARKFERFSPLLQRPFRGPLDFLKADMLRALPLFRPWSTVDEDLGRWFKDPRVRLAFSFQSKYLGMSPFKCPSLFTIIAHVEYGHGVYHPIGGCGAILAAMARCARAMGVEIRLSEPIEALLFEGRRVVGARTERGVHPADAVVVNADFATAMTRLVPDGLRRRWTDAKIATKRFSCSTFMLYLGIEGLERDLHHHTIHLSRDYLGNIRDIENHRAPDDPTIYVQNAGVTDPSLAPEGMSTLYCLAPVGNLEGGVDWEATAPRYRALILRRLEMMGVRDVERRIRYERILTPTDWEARGIYRGATFNLAHNLGQMLHWRPQNRFEDLEGVYLTGGGTHPGSGLPTIFESARIASKLLAQDLKLDVGAVPASALSKAAEEAA